MERRNDSSQLSRRAALARIGTGVAVVASGSMLGRTALEAAAAPAEPKNFGEFQKAIAALATHPKLQAALDELQSEPERKKAKADPKGFLRKHGIQLPEFLEVKIGEELPEEGAAGMVRALPSAAIEVSGSIKVCATIRGRTYCLTFSAS